MILYHEHPKLDDIIRFYFETFLKINKHCFLEWIQEMIITLITSLSFVLVAALVVVEYQDRIKKYHTGKIFISEKSLKLLF